MGAQWKAKGKELAANAKGKIFGKLSKDIMLAARSGADPAANSRLRLLVEAGAQSLDAQRHTGARHQEKAPV
jgi:transcriptional/translational regulatory protein YebC/TACO1